MKNTLGQFLVGLIGLANCAVSLAQSPDLGKFRAFVASPPYSVLVKGVPRAVNLGGMARHHTFAPLNTFVNAATGQADVATMLAGDPVELKDGNGVYWGASIQPQGVPGRIAIAGERLMIAYRAGDAVVAGKSRTQISSYAVPARQKVAWELSFTLGNAELRTGWPVAPVASHPVAIWELKAPDAQPSLTMVVDTNPADPQSLSLIFGRRSGMAATTTRIAQVNGINRYQTISVVMEAYLDERDLLQQGQGYWRTWVNGNLVLDTVGPTLSARANEPHQWFLATYLYQDSEPVPDTWITYWSAARMLVPN